MKFHNSGPGPPDLFRNLSNELLENNILTIKQQILT